MKLSCSLVFSRTVKTNTRLLQKNNDEDKNIENRHPARLYEYFLYFNYILYN